MVDARTPLEGSASGAVPEPAPPGDLFAQLDQDRFDVAGLRGGLFGRFRVAEAMLKARGAVMREIRVPGAPAEHAFSLLLVVVVFGAVYGALLGMFGGIGTQIPYAAAKIPLVVLGTTFLCLPTFYVFNSILGSRLTLGQTAMLLMLQAGAIAVLLIGFAPIAWFFTVSTGGPGFMSFFHITVFAIALWFGVRWLDAARRYLQHLEGTQASARGDFFAVWVILFIVVGCQMAYYLRPLLEPGPFFTGERGLFTEFLGSLLGGGRGAYGG